MMRSPLLYCALDLALLAAKEFDFLPAWVPPPLLLVVHTALLLLALRGMRRRETPVYMLDPRVVRALAIAAFALLLPPLVTLFVYVWTGEGLRLALMTTFSTTVILAAADYLYEVIEQVVERWTDQVAAASMSLAAEVVSSGGSLPPRSPQDTSQT